MTMLETGLPAPQGSPSPRPSPPASGGRGSTFATPADVSASPSLLERGTEATAAAEHVAAVPPLPPLAGGEDRGEGDQVPAWRLIVTLALAGALAGLLIVTVFQWAQPRILAHQAEVLRAAVGEVLKGPERTERFFVHQDALVVEPPAGTDTLRIQRVFLGYDAAGAPIGFAISGAEPGFMDLVHVIFGYDPRTRRVLGMKVLDNKETPGLGDAIEKDQRFVSGFDGPLAPLLGVKPGASQAENEVDMITGATISARTVISVINNRIEALQPLLEAHLREAGS